ncbi:heterokaryon incompatibility protein-domain-containing protein [Apiospora arundinis]
MALATRLEYTYRPLPTNAQTRIIELLPSSPSDEAATPLRCRLRDFNVHGYEDYEAVSYTWGEPHFTEKLIIDDDCFLMITVNLRDALLRFRRQDCVRLLWVDAVCINQRDEGEKGLQIPQMAHIYSGASRVLVWLGDFPEAVEPMLQVEKFARRIHILSGRGTNDQVSRAHPYENSLDYLQYPTIVDKIRPSRTFHQERIKVVSVAVDCMQPLDAQGLQWRREFQIRHRPAPPGSLRRKVLR